MLASLRAAADSYGLRAAPSPQAPNPTVAFGDGAVLAHLSGGAVLADLRSVVAILVSRTESPSATVVN